MPSRSQVEDYLWFYGVAGEYALFSQQSLQTRLSNQEVEDWTAVLHQLKEKPMAKIELYTFGEIIKLLGVTSNELNVLIETGKLKPVRHQGRLKFKKDEVEILKQEREQPVDRYSWDEVLRELQIEEEELQRMVCEGEVQVFQEQFTTKFDKKEIETIKHSRQVDVTIVVEQQPSRDFFDEIPSMQVPQEELSELSYSIESKKDSAQEYYRFSQVLGELQIEPKELEGMLASGELSAFHDKGELKFLKAEIEFIKNERMVDATMVVEAQSKDSGEVEEEDIQPILISATGTEAMPRQRPVVEEEEFYTFDEAAYELQIEPDELKRMIAKQELEAVKDCGQLKFRKKDIDNRAQKIEPTVILPEEEQQSQEDTVDFYEEPVEEQVKAKALAPQLNKSFYSCAEAAQVLELDDFDLQNLIGQGIIQTYRYEGEQKIKRGDLFRLIKTLSGGQPRSASLTDVIELIPPVDALPQKLAAKPAKPAKPASPAPPTPPVVKVNPPQPEYYTIEEVRGLLQLEERNIKKMVACGQLKVKRVGKTYHFSKQQVDDIVESKMLDPTITMQAHEIDKHLKNIEKSQLAPAKAIHSQPLEAKAPSPPPQPQRSTISFRGVMQMLSLNKSDIDRLISQSHLTLLPGNCFYRDQVEELKSNDEVELTMVLPLFNESDEEDEDEEDELAYLAAPIPKPKPHFRSPVLPAQPIARKINLANYYSFKQALIELQLESNELEQLIRKGELQCIRQEGQRWIEKIALEDVKKGKMIEPTIMVDSESDDILEEEDDDDDLFFLK